LHRLTFHDAATALGLTYEQVRRRAQCGELESAEPLDGKFAVSFRSVATMAARTNRDLGDLVDPSGFEELSPRVTAFHLLGVERAAFLRQLEADALEAEHVGDLGRAAVFWQLWAGLGVATYQWQPARNTWRVRIPGYPDLESAAPPAETPHALAPESA